MWLDAPRRYYPSSKMLIYALLLRLRQQFYSRKVDGITCQVDFQRGKLWLNGWDNRSTGRLNGWDNRFTGRLNGWDNRSTGKLNGRDNRATGRPQVKFRRARLVLLLRFQPVLFRLRRRARLQEPVHREQGSDPHPWPRAA